MARWPLPLSFALCVSAGLAACRAGDLGEKGEELRTLTLKDYGIELRVPSGWTVVNQADEAMVFAIAVRDPDPSRLAGFKCEIAAAPESLDEYRARIARRAERQAVPGLTLAENEIVADDGAERLITRWDYAAEPAGVVHDLELRRIAHDQLYTFTLRAPDAVFASLRPRFEKLVGEARFSAPETGLELTRDGYCLQKKFRFGLKLPRGWKPSFPLSKESLFWATGEPRGIWSDNLLVIASPARPLDFDSLAERLPEELRREDPACTVKSCRRVPQGKSGESLETVVETSRGPFRITVLERRYPGRRENYEIKFTVMSETFEQRADELRRSADSFVEFLAPEDLKGGAT